jgi:hypothetical protein
MGLLDRLRRTSDGDRQPVQAAESPAVVQELTRQAGGGFDFVAAGMLDQRGADLAGANLSGTNLRDAVLVGANLRGANLANADLTGANLREADLQGASLAGASLLAANLHGANLTGADFAGSNLSNASFAAVTGVQEVVSWNGARRGGLRDDEVRQDIEREIGFAAGFVQPMSGDLD